jgi:hypothetical protein
MCYLMCSALAGKLVGSKEGGGWSQRSSNEDMFTSFLSFLRTPMLFGFHFPTS